MSYKKSQYLAYTEIINKDQSLEHQKRLAYSTRSGTSLVLSEAIFNALQGNLIDNIPDDLKEGLITSQLLVPADEDEFSAIMQQNNSKNINTLGLVVHTSANCQFGCSYCGQQHSKKSIDNNVKNKLYEYVDKRLLTNMYKFLFVTWHGAEPLMSLTDLRVMSKRFLDSAEKYQAEYSSKIITNGLSLKPAIFNELYYDLKITHYQITVDGNREFHDLRRMTKEGKPTFDIIMDNIVQICNSPSYPYGSMPISLRINIDKSNAPGVFDLIDLLHSYNLQDKLAIVLRPVENYGENKFKESNSFSKEEYAALEIDLILYALQKGFVIPDILPERKHDACMAVVKDYAAFDIFGNIYPCYSFPYTKHELEAENKIGSLLLNENTYNENTPLRNWYQVIEETKNPCYSCNLLPVCGGYCPLKWYEGEIACPSYKYNTEERIKLNYLFNKANVNELLNHQ